MRKLILLLLVLGLVVTGSSVAQAHIQQFDVDAVFVNDQGEIIGVTGTITCTEGERFAINGELFQGTKENPRESTARFRATGQCTGDTQRWSTDNVTQDGPFTCDRPAGARARARSFENRELHDTRFFEGAVRVICR